MAATPAPLQVTLDDPRPAFLVREGDSLVLRREGCPDCPVTGACLSLTSRCNEACVMCLEDRDPRHPVDLPFAAARRLARLFGGAVPVVNSSTSEALLYPRFLDFARELKARGSGAGVVTNGLALARPGYLQALAEAGLRQVMISCHTADARTFGELTGRPRAFPTFVRALDVVDAWNRDAAPGAAVKVIVEVVLMRPLLGRVPELLAFLAAHLGHSRPTLRVETFRPINVARGRTELQPDWDEVAALMAAFLAGTAPPLGLEARHVPLCLLPGHEHLASEVGQTLRREKALGNTGCRTLALREQMRAQCALEQLACAHVCWGCGLALVCPGVFDIPLRPGGGAPSPPRATLAAVAGRLDPPIPAAQLAAAVDAALIDRRGDGAAASRFAAADLPRLTALVQRLVERGHRVESNQGRVLVEFADAGQEDGTARVLITPASGGGPSYLTVGGLSIAYSGALSPRVKRAIETLGAQLARGAV
jgi:hypothetical protein